MACRVGSFLYFPSTSRFFARTRCGRCHPLSRRRRRSPAAGGFGGAQKKTHEGIFPVLGCASALRPMLPARALVRSLRTFLAGSRPHAALSLPCSPAPAAALRRSLSLSSAAALPPSLPQRRGLLLSAPLLPLPPAAGRAGAVRWGSRKAGSTGFKTKSSIKKRFRVTGGGALRRLASGKRHLNLHKSSARIRRLGEPWLWPRVPARARAPLAASALRQTRPSHPLPSPSPRPPRARPHTRARPRRAKNDQEQGPAQALPARLWPVPLSQIDTACYTQPHSL